MKNIIENYQEYVPALAANGKIDLALKLLTHVYADNCLKDDIRSEIESLFDKIQKGTYTGAKALAPDTLENLQKSLNDRIVWVCNKNIKDEHYTDKYKKDCYRNHFWHKLQSRVDGWKRDIFPLDIINRLITSNKEKSIWKDEIYKRIDVLASDGKYYNVIKEVNAIVFSRENEKDRYQVYVNFKNGTQHQVFTPCADRSQKHMEVYDPEQVSIDHTIPLNYIVKRILEDQKDQDIRDELNKVIEARKKYHGWKAMDIAKEIKENINEGLLTKLKNKVLEDTMCVLMEQGENSKKSDTTPFLRYEKKGDKYKFIVAEHVMNPVDQKLYTISYTLENKIYSEIQMEIENG